MTTDDGCAPCRSPDTEWWIDHVVTGSVEEGLRAAPFDLPDGCTALPLALGIDDEAQLLPSRSRLPAALPPQPLHPSRHPAAPVPPRQS